MQVFMGNYWYFCPILSKREMPNIILLSLKIRSLILLIVSCVQTERAINMRSVGIRKRMKSLTQ